MYTLKTKENNKDVLTFLQSIEHPTRRSDGLLLLDLFERKTKEPPKMWGESIVGFGRYTYTNKSKMTAQWMRVGFSPRKQSLSLYLMNGHEDLKPLLSQLGKHKLGKGCLYINKLSDINIDILGEIIEASFKASVKSYPE